MRGRYLLVVAVAVLAISAQPVAAQNASAVASEHTTFGTGSAGEPAPASLTNMSVTGSGEGASVVLNQTSNQAVIESFSDGDLSEYNGDTGAATIETSTPLGSSEALELSGPGGGVGRTITSTSGLPAYPSRGDIISYRVASSDTDTEARFRFGVGGGGAGNYSVVLDGGTITLRRIDSSSFTALNSTSFSFAADTAYRVEVVWGDPTITVRVYQSGSQIAAIQADDTTYDSGGVYWGIYDRDTASSVYFDDLEASLSTAAESGQYLGAPHDAGDVTTGWANLSLQNASATVVWQEDADGDGAWTNVSSTTVSSTTNVTQDLSATTSDRWRVRVDVAKTGSDPVAQIHDEGLLFKPSRPTLSNLDPPDDSQISDYRINISANVSDTDLGLVQGDSVTVTAESDGQTINSTTITSNQTVSFPFDAVAGSNTVTWTVTDAYGRSSTTTQTFATPAELRVVDELNQTLIDNVTITVRYYGQATQDPIIEDRTISDGTANLSGFPSEQPLIVVVDAPGYVPRRIYLTSYYEQRTIYLLPDSADRVNKEFVLNDFTGRFEAEETVLQVQRALNGSWQTVQGDYFGSAGTVSAQLQYNSRHRLVVQNTETGDERIFRGFTPLSSGEQPIRITADSTIVVREGAPSVVVEPSVRTLAAQNETLTIGVEERSATVTNLSATVVYRNNTTTETLATASSDGSELSPTLNLSGREGGTVSVSVAYQTADGVSGGQAVEFGVSALYDNPSSLLNAVGSITDTIPGERATEAFQAAVAILLTVVLTAAFAGSVRASTEIVGAVALFLLGGWAIIGWLSYNIVFAGALGWIGVTALRRGI